MSELEPTRTYSNPTATDVLRRLLDERGVEYEGGERSVRWRDRNGVMMQAFPLADGELGMDVWSCTPAQAIAATLGSCNCSDNCTNSERTETCHDVWDTELTGRLRFQCSECGGVSLEITPNYCPICGRKVVSNG
jgi:rubrerythrin